LDSNQLPSLLFTTVDRVEVALMSVDVNSEKKGVAAAALDRPEHAVMLAWEHLYQSAGQGVRLPTAVRARFKEDLVVINPSFQGHTEHGLWKSARRLEKSRMDRIGALNGDGGLRGSSPTTAKSGPYASGTLDNIEAVLDVIYVRCARASHSNSTSASRSSVLPQPPSLGVLLQ